MLRESPQARPNIYQVLREACAMQGREPPIKDVSDTRSANLSTLNKLTLPRYTRAGHSRTFTGATSLSLTLTEPNRRPP